MLEDIEKQHPNGQLKDNIRYFEFLTYPDDAPIIEPKKEEEEEIEEEEAKQETKYLPWEPGYKEEEEAQEEEEEHEGT